MWIITVLPDWVFHLIFFAGLSGTVAGFVLGFIPVIRKYIISVRVVSLIVLCLGLFLEGALSDYREWELKVKELEVKLKEAEVKSEKVNTEVITKVITQKQVIREKGKDIIQYVDREIVKYDTKCEIPAQVIKAHDAAAKNESIVDATTLIPTHEINKAAKGIK